MDRVLSFLPVLLCLLPAAAEKRTITHEDVWLMTRAGSPVLSPDGKWAVFSVAEPSYDSTAQRSDLWMVPTAGGPVKRLTFTRGAESGAVFSPDGKRLAFTAKREGDEAPQIYVLPLDGGEAVRVTTLSTGASDPLWSPDGATLLFQSEVYSGCADDECNKKEAARRKAEKSTARVFDSFPIRFWNFWLDQRHPHLFVQDAVEGARARDLLAGTRLADTPGFAGEFNPTGAGESLEAVWMPGGQEVVFSAVVNRDQTMTAPVESHLFRLPVRGGEPVRLTAAGRSWGAPVFSPDGRALYASTEENESAKQPYHLRRLARAAGPSWDKFEILTGAWDRSVSAFTVASDSASVWIEAEDDGYDKIFRLPATGGPVEMVFQPQSGALSGLKTAAGVFAARYSASTDPGQIVRFEPAAKSFAPLTGFNAERLAALDLPKPEHFWFTARDGRRIHCLLVPPPALDPHKKYPLIVFPHGGPNSMSKDSFTTRWNYHLLTSPGYFLLMPDFKGSTGYGEKFTNDIETDVLRGPSEEILDSIEEALRRYPAIDRTRQAAVGASYGGYLMNWLNSRTTQFRCLVNHAGAVNNISQYGVNDGGYGRELRMGVPVWEPLRGQWLAQSPFVYAAKWRTPTLITQGEQDFRVPYGESMTTFKILQRLGVPARLVIFPDEGHWILKGPNSKKHMEEVLAWLKKYLDPAEPAWRPPARSN